jgi:hypothetical protein
MALVRRLVFAGALAVLAAASLFSQTAQPAASKPSPDTPPSSGIALTPADPKEIIRKARQSYYSLKAAGLIEFQCQVLPDWDSIYKDVPPDASGQDQLLPILKKVRFQVVFTPGGAPLVSHSDVTPPNEQVATQLQKTITNLQQVITGFLNEWSLFAVAPPLPEIDGDYQLQDSGGLYHLAYKHGSGDVSTTMNRDFAIEELNFSSAKTNGSMLPILTKEKGGFVLTGYNATYLGADNSSLQMSVTIENQDVEGFELPAKVTAAVPVSMGKVTFPLTFTEYQVKKR